MTFTYNDPDLKNIRKTLRKDQTKAEKIIWQHLKNKQLKGFKFYRQYSVEFYVLDFYCPKAKLAIEIDGPYHLNPEVRECDQERQMDIESLGIKFLRFTNEKIYHNLNHVLEKIKMHLPPFSP